MAIALPEPSGHQLEFLHNEQSLGTLSWDLSGRHNALNALAAVTAASAAGIEPSVAIASPGRVQGRQAANGTDRRSQRHPDL